MPEAAPSHWYRVPAEPKREDPRPRPGAFAGQPGNAEGQRIHRNGTRRQGTSSVQELRPLSVSRVPEPASASMTIHRECGTPESAGAFPAGRWSPTEDQENFRPLQRKTLRRPDRGFEKKRNPIIDEVLIDWTRRSAKTSLTHEDPVRSFELLGDPRMILRSGHPGLNGRCVIPTHGDQAAPGRPHFILSRRRRRGRRCGLLADCSVVGR